MPTTKPIAFSDSSPIFYDRRKLTVAQQVVLWNMVSEQPNLTSAQVLKKTTKHTESIEITIRHFNRIRVKWGVSRKKGRPSTPASQHLKCKNLVKIIPALASIGVHLFAEWMESQDNFSAVLEQLRQSIKIWRKQHPDENFPLLFHRDKTLLLRFKAIFYAPLLGINKLTEVDYKEHCLSSLIGKGYQSSTLTQYLGELERIDAGQQLRNILIPENPGNLCYISRFACLNINFKILIMEAKQYKLKYF